MLTSDAASNTIAPNSGSVNVKGAQDLPARVSADTTRSANPTMTEADLPFVSVVTPVYNGADYLGECIESVLKQSYPNLEHVIVNNASTDKTLEVALSYAARDKRVVVHDCSAFVGVIENHNRAISLMSQGSRYCKVVCADDWLYPDCLRQLVSLAEAHPTLGMVGSYSIAGGRVLWQGLPYERSIVNGRELCRATLLGGPYVFGSPTSVLYRADLTRKRPAFFPSTNPHADTSVCYECLSESDFGFVHQVLSYTRVHADSQTSSSLSHGTIKCAQIMDMARYGPQFLAQEDAKRLLAQAIDKYYSWLVPALLENRLSAEFLHEQERALAEIGLKLNHAKVAKAALLRGLEIVQQPALTLRKLSKLVQRHGKVEARYYD
jgi:glycosyltransferase involved in cell wall biosynthesis